LFRWEIHALPEIMRNPPPSFSWSVPITFYKSLREPTLLPPPIERKRLHQILHGEVGRVPAIQDRFGDGWGEVRKPQDATHVGAFDILGGVQCYRPVSVLGEAVKA